MAEVLIKRGAMLKGKGFNCFNDYIIQRELHMLDHFFNHPEFIYREHYMEDANYVDNEYMENANYVDNESIVELLKRKRDRQRAVIVMSALADRYRTDVYVHLTSLVESFL